MSILRENLGKLKELSVESSLSYVGGSVIIAIKSLIIVKILTKI